MDNYNPGQQSASASDGKTVGIVSYLTLIGWLVAYFAMHKDKKTDIGSYQLRQTLLLYIIGIALSIIVRVLSGVAAVVYASYVVNLILVIFWIIGIIGAANGQKKPMPLIGDKAQTMFPGI